MHVRRSLVACALAPLLLGLALSGCQEAEPTPKMPETAASSATPTETPSAEQESPEDFIRRWTEGSLNAQNTGDTGDYISMTQGCAPCTSFADRVEDIYDSGGSIKLNRLEVTNVSKTDVIDRFKVKRVSGKTKVFDARGKTTQSFPGGREVLIVTLRQGSKGWSVMEFVRVAT